MTERVLSSYTALPNPSVVDIYSGVEVIRRQHEGTGQLLVVIGTNHKAVRQNPEARAIKNEFSFVIDPSHNRGMPVNVFTEAQTLTIKHKGKLLQGARGPAIDTGKINQAMKLHTDMGLISALSAINNCNLDSILSILDERDIILQLSEQFSPKAIMMYLTARKIPQWERMHVRRRRKPKLGDYLEDEVITPYSLLLAGEPGWKDFDFSLRNSIGRDRKDLNDCADSRNIEQILKQTVGQMRGQADRGSILQEVSTAYHYLKDSMSLDKLTDGWGEESTPNVIYTVGKAHVRAIAGELVAYGVAVNRTSK